MIPFDLRIFFQMGGKQPPTRKYIDSNHLFFSGAFAVSFRGAVFVKTQGNSQGGEVRNVNPKNSLDIVYGISTTNLNWWVGPGFLVAINNMTILFKRPLLDVIIHCLQCLCRNQVSSKHTHDGWTPAPGRLFSYLQGVLHPRWCRISSINSTYMERVSDPQECFVSLSHAEAGMTWNDMS